MVSKRRNHSRSSLQIKGILIALVSLTTMFSAACSSNPTDIVWADEIRIHGMTYVSAGNTFIAGTDTGPQYATVTHRLEGNVHDPNYQLRDGDAAYIDGGTPIYSVKGYQPSYRIAAISYQKMHYYDVATSSSPARGQDIFEMTSANISTIQVVSSSQSSLIVKEITATDQITLLVSDLLASSQTTANFVGEESPPYFVRFIRQDKVQVVRGYWPDRKIVSPNILVPSEFVQLLSA